jgi:hypothetical protein
MHTPVPFLITVLYSVGDLTGGANSVMVEPPLGALNRVHQSQSISARVELPLRFLLEMNTPVPFLTTVLSSVGDAILKENWALVKDPRTRLLQFPSTSVLGERQLQFLLEKITPAPFLTMVH